MQKKMQSTSTHEIHMCGFHPDPDDANAGALCSVKDISRKGRTFGCVRCNAHAFKISMNRVCAARQPGMKIEFPLSSSISTPLDERRSALKWSRHAEAVACSPLRSSTATAKTAVEAIVSLVDSMIAMLLTGLTCIQLQTT
jgi:hypothetical protein